MRFMMIRRAEANSEGNDIPAEGLVQEMLAYHEEMAAAGILRGGAGLKPSRYGKLLQVRDDATTVVDGPYAETKELIAGYTIIEVESLDEAVEWASKWPKSDGPVDIELREFYENDDITEDADISARFDEIMVDKTV